MSASRAATARSLANPGPALADAIRERLDEDGETLEGASVRLGLKPNTLWRWTSKSIEPTAPFYGVLMDYLGVSLDELGVLIVREQLRRWNREHPS